MVTLKYKPEPDYVSEVFNSQVLNVLFSKICFFTITVFQGYLLEIFC